MKTYEMVLTFFAQNLFGLVFNVLPVILILMFGCIAVQSVARYGIWTGRHNSVKDEQKALKQTREMLRKRSGHKYG